MKREGEGGGVQTEIWKVKFLHKTKVLVFVLAFKFCFEFQNLPCICTPLMYHL